MTKDEVKYVIQTTLGEIVNKPVPLVSVKYVLLNKREKKFVDPAHMRFEFDMNNELLKCYQCKKTNAAIPSNYEYQKQYDTYKKENYIYMCDEAGNPYIDVYDFDAITIIARNMVDNKTKFNVTFVNYDGIILLEKSCAFGSFPEYTGNTPTRMSDAKYNYIFSGWTPEQTTVTDEITYKAVYEKVPKE